MRLMIALVLICSASAASEPRFVPREEIWGVDTEGVQRLYNYSFEDREDAELVIQLGDVLSKNPKTPLQLTAKNTFTAMLLTGSLEEVLEEARCRLESPKTKRITTSDKVTYLFFTAPMSTNRLVIDRVYVDGTEITIDYFYQFSPLRGLLSPFFIAPVGELQPGKYTVKTVPSKEKVQPRTVVTAEELAKRDATPTFTPQFVIVSSTKNEDEHNTNPRDTSTSGSQ